MDVNAYTLQLIDNYIEATGQGVFRRASLSPAEYLMFRKQAEEECKYTVPVTNTVSVTAPVQQIPVPTVNAETCTPKLVSNPKPLSAPEQTSSYTDSEPFWEDNNDDEDDMASLLKSIEG